MATVTKKMVVLPDAKPIFPKGGISGPIMTPYMETVPTIGTLLMRGYRVTEVLANNVRIPLTLSNFDQDNSKPAGPTQEELDRLAAEEAARQAAEQERLVAEEKRLAEEAAAKKAEEEALAKEQENQEQVSSMRFQQQKKSNQQNKIKQQQKPDAIEKK